MSSPVCHRYNAVALSRLEVEESFVVFIACLVPLGLYLLLLGWVNRQPRPVLVSGAWDFVGILFAASGFVFAVGPAVLTSLSERWRMFWLLGETGSVTEGLDAARQAYLVAAGLYFLVVVVVCAVAFARRRGMTAIYNVEPATAVAALTETCEQLGLEPIHSGNVFVFGLMLGRSPRAFGIQTPHRGIQRPHAASAAAPRDESTAEDEYVGQNAVLEVETFPAMKHVTLRWDPADAPLRTAVEADLDRRLGRLGSPYHDTGAWLTLVASGVLGAAMLITAVLMLRTVYLR